MQSGSTPVQGKIISKSKLLAITSIAVVAILAVPIVLPHVMHESMIYHIILHLGSVIVAIFLSAISFISYTRNGSMRILLMTLAFLSLTGVELLSLFTATGNLELITIPAINAELSHIFLLLMVILFGLGVLKVD
jgi:hypothetical protein